MIRTLIPPSLYRLAYKLQLAYFWVRRPLTLGVRGLVTDDRGRVLLVRHTYRKGWHLPGGGVGRGESAQDALRRELLEEVGVTPRGDMALFGAYVNFQEFKSDHVLVFRVPAFDIGPSESPEIAERAFFPVDDPPTDISPGTARRLAELKDKAVRNDRW
jgi:8-oxo-dGTP pyrophosphatase MutT (NUDIX family)